MQLHGHRTKMCTRTLPGGSFTQEREFLLPVAARFCPILERTGHATPRSTIGSAAQQTKNKSKSEIEPND